MVCGLMFYVVDRNVTQKDNFMEIGGERKTVQLPSCRVLKLTQPPVVWKQKKEGIVEAERMFSFGEVPLEVTAGDSLQQGSFSYAGDMEAFMSMTSVGDTLLVTFDFPEDKLEQHLQNDIWIRVRSEGMELRLPAEVQAVVVDVEDMEANFYGLRCDTLSFRTRYLARLEDCHVTALAAQAQSLHFNSGTVRNLYLNLDEIADWDVNTGSFHIDTEHLSGSRYHRCLLQKNECRRVFWTPLKDDASLSVELKQAVKIEVGGDIGLGVMGGIGLAILTFGFGLQPTSPPIDVMLMIAAVISAASCMQAAGGLDYMVKLAERLLRKNPSQVTILSPIVTYLFTFVAGTGHVAYSVLPVIAEVATETKIHPERPLGIAVIASQQAITASPISAATVALLGLLAGFDVTLFDILKITIPATIIGVLVGALFSMKVGKELADDPEYRKRLTEGYLDVKKVEIKDIHNKRHAVLSVLIFILATVFIVFFGSFDSLRPAFVIDGETVRLGMSAIIEIVMLSAAALILLLTRTDGMKATQGSVFPAGMQAVIAIFGIAWMGDTFLQGNMLQLIQSVEGVVRQMPWLFGIALFAMSILLYSQAATVRALMPLGIALGISPMILVALFPAVNGYFFIPNYPTVVAAINFDRTGTTRIGKYVLNHSFMLPGLVSTGVAIGLGLLFIRIF